MRGVFLLAGLALVASGCTNVYESGGSASEAPVDCDPTFEREQLDDGATSPLRCELENESSSENQTG